MHILIAMTYHKKQWIWWDLTKAKNRPAWIHHSIKQQAGEIVDVESEHAMIAIMNESYKVEKYLVPIDQIRKRGAT
jgi:hypothetical protein